MKQKVKSNLGLKSMRFQAFCTKWGSAELFIVVNTALWLFSVANSVIFFFKLLGFITECLYVYDLTDKDVLFNLETPFGV